MLQPERRKEENPASKMARIDPTLRYWRAMWSFQKVSLFGQIFNKKGMVKGANKYVFLLT